MHFPPANGRGIFSFISGLGCSIIEKAEKPSLGESRQGGHSMKILIIEDEKLLADSLKTLLEKKGFAVECVYDG